MVLVYTAESAHLLQTQKFHVEMSNLFNLFVLTKFFRKI